MRPVALGSESSQIKAQHCTEVRFRAGNNAAEESPSKTGDFEWEDSAEIWAHLKPVDLMLPIVFLTVEWLLDAPAESRWGPIQSLALMLQE